MVDTDSYQIVAYCCEHCAYGAADLAGGLRLQYPPEVKIVLIPCTGKIDTLMVLHAFEAGIDGVMVAGCLPGDCHYLEGNENANRRIERIKNLLEQIGLEPERVNMYNLSSAMAGEFTVIVEETTNKIISIGKNPLLEERLR
ncbi:MAG: hydrogenase iron-sulfur subunit [Chloroflexi bacterium]|nr:hydrogenase iron-sulfur subunit [Chloroflexota bacterium]